MLIAGNGDSIFKRLMATIGRNDLGERPGPRRSNDGRVALASKRLDEAIEAWTQTTHAATTSSTILDQRDVPAGTIYSVDGHRRGPAVPRPRDMIVRQSRTLRRLRR